MNVIVKTSEGLYRMPVQRVLDKDKFEKFQIVNGNCEVLLFPLNRSRPVVLPISQLEFVKMQEERG